jgi:hypothetical protein
MRHSAESWTKKTNETMFSPFQPTSRITSPIFGSLRMVWSRSQEKGSCHFWCIISHPHSQSPIQQLCFQWTQTQHYLQWHLDSIPYVDLQPTYLLSRQRDPPVRRRHCVSFLANQIPPKCTLKQRILQSQVLVYSNRTNLWR